MSTKPVPPIDAPSKKPTKIALSPSSASPTASSAHSLSSPTTPPLTPRPPTTYRAPVDMSGWVNKYQSRMPSCVRRYFRLADTVLYNQSQLTTKPTWNLPLSRATVRADYDRNLIILSCPKRHLRFQLATSAETHRWLVALRTAALCNIADFYKLGSTIGTGSFGTVCEGVDLATNARRAVKIVHRTSNQKEREFVHREMSVLLTISHPNIVRTFDIFDERHRILVVMAFVPGGDLFDYVVQRSILDGRAVKHAMWQVMHGVAYLHDRNIVHRDIKLENVLVAQATPLRIQLTDFGFANFIDPSSEAPARDLNSVVGTGSYMAPEVIDGRGHGTPVDIFAAGVVMYRLCSGHMPFRAISLRESYELALAERADFASKIWQAVGKEARQLCRSMLSADPAKRPSAVEVLAHEWFASDESFLAEAAESESNARKKEEKELHREQELSDKHFEGLSGDVTPSNLSRRSGSRQK